MIIRDKIYISLGTLGRKVTDLCDLFTYRNPEYYIKKQQKLSVAKISPTMCHYKVDVINDERYLVLPRGGFKRVKEFYEQNDLPLRVADERLVLPEIDCNLLNTVLEPQQEIIINALMENDGGLIQSDTGSGKTISVLGYITRLKQPTLIIVHEHKLRTQWEDEMTNRLNGNFTIGRYDGEVKRDGDVCIAVINTAYKFGSTDSDMLTKFGLIIIDETHRASSMMFLNILNNSPSRYRAGVSATVERKDGNHILIYDLLGDILINIAAKDVKHRITTFDYEFINTDVKVEIPTRKRWTGYKQEDVLDYTSYVSLLIDDEVRNDLIISRVVQDITDGYYPLVLSSRIKHLDLLYKRLKDLGYNTILLKGSKSKKNRVDWNEVRKDTAVQVIVATDSIASEGLDLPALSSIHLTLHSSNQPKVKQKIGRIRRELKDKPIPVVRYYVDNEAYLVTPKGSKAIFYYSAKKMEQYLRTLQKDYEEG